MVILNSNYIYIQKISRDKRLRSNLSGLVLIALTHFTRSSNIIRKLVFHYHFVDSYTEKPCVKCCFQSETIDLENSETSKLVAKFFKDPTREVFFVQ